jgi:3,4-dihydroxy 2-butanone 4-phosphate synthase/GTP cyclohydrolase II
MTALEHLRAGEAVILYDEGADAGHLLALADGISGQTVTAMIVYGGGNMAIALPWERCTELGLRAMPNAAGALANIEAASGVSTGISAADRARTIAVAADAASGPGDLVSPGHVVPLPARSGGLLERRGRAEAAVDAAAFVGAPRAAALCEILDDAGALAGHAYVDLLARRAGFAVLSLSELVAERAERELCSW